MGAMGELGEAVGAALTAAAEQQHSTAWSLAAPLFAGSFVPYALFLRSLRKAPGATDEMTAAFSSLLVFVAATTPVDCWAAVAYGEALANVDPLHFTIQSLMTGTNLLILLAFRHALDALDGRSPPSSPSSSSQRGLAGLIVASGAVHLLAAGAFAVGLPAATGALATVGPEPTNALSVPTWALHILSLEEWLVAMGLVWEYAERTRNPAWRGLVWAMVPLFAGGLTACIFHLFYNQVEELVALQAVLTFGGNVALCFAGINLATAHEDGAAAAARHSPRSQRRRRRRRQRHVPYYGFEDVGLALRDDSDAELVAKLAAGAIALGALVKHGSLLLEAPLHPSLAPAILLVAAPTLLSASRWALLAAVDAADALESDNVTNIIEK